MHYALKHSRIYSIVFLKESLHYLLHFPENGMNSQPILGDGMKSKDAVKASSQCLEWNPACGYVNVSFLRYRIIQMRLFKTLLLLSKLLYKSGKKVIELKVWES